MSKDLFESPQANDIPTSLLEEINEAISHYPISSRSASLPLLHLWQNHFGFIDESGIEWIANKLGLEPINILELVSFYPWFRQHLSGRHIIRICRTLSCAMSGSYELHREFCKTLSLNPDQENKYEMLTTMDKKYSIEFVECLASCGSAPVCLIDDDLHEDVHESDIPKILNQYD